MILILFIELTRFWQDPISSLTDMSGCPGPCQAICSGFHLLSSLSFNEWVEGKEVMFLLTGHCMGQDCVRVNIIEENPKLRCEPNWGYSSFQAQESGDC